MKKMNFTRDDIEKKIPNKYAAVLAVSSRAKYIRENPEETEDQDRKLKPTDLATKEFLEGTLKYPDFDIKKINVAD